jgi:hypothetical protein
VLGTVPRRRILWLQMIHVSQCDVGVFGCNVLLVADAG